MDVLLQWENKGGGDTVCVNELEAIPLEEKLNVKPGVSVHMKCKGKFYIATIIATEQMDSSALDNQPLSVFAATVKKSCSNCSLCL